MGEAKYWILVVQCYSHFPNTCSLSLPASADCPGTNSSADGAARPSDRQLLAVCSLICDQTSLFLFLFPDPIFTQFLSYVNSTGKHWWDVNLGNTAGNLWSNRNSWCCGSSEFFGRWIWRELRMGKFSSALAAISCRNVTFASSRSPLPLQHQGLIL